MNISKRKYKRSQWMEGLLWAENLVKDGGNAYVGSPTYGYNRVDQWVHGTTGEGIRVHLCVMCNFASGVQDHLDHYDENSL